MEFAAVIQTVETPESISARRRSPKLVIARQRGNGMATGTKLNLNTATVDELTGIPGISRSRAELLVMHRDQNGPYRDWEDFNRVVGFAQSKIRTLQEEYLVIE